MHLASLDLLYKRMGFNESPFNLTPDTDFFFSSRTHNEALKHMRYGQFKGGFSVLTGEVGMGKTLLCRQLVKANNDTSFTVVYIYNPARSVAELISSISYALTGKLIRSNSVVELEHKFVLSLLSLAKQGKRVIVVVDESHLLPEEVLDGLRTLANLETSKRKLLSFILVGQPELLTTLRKYSLRSLRQRITTHYKLKAFRYTDTADYLDHRMAMSRIDANITFSKPAKILLHRLSSGTPRRINQIADRCLMAAFLADKAEVTLAMVWSANKEVFI